MTFEEEMVAVALELITEFGSPVSITSAPAGLDANTLLPSAGTTIGTGVAVSYTPARADSPEATLTEEVRRKHRWFYLQTAVDVTIGQTLTFLATGKVFLIHTEKRVMVDLLTAYYEVSTSEVT